MGARSSPSDGRAAAPGESASKIRRGRRGGSLGFGAAVAEAWTVPLPIDVTEPFEVFVNGVPQEEGRDYDLEGRELWRIQRMGAVAIQSPFAWNDILYMTSGTGGDDNKPNVAIRAGGSGDITPSEPANKNAHVVWYERIAGGTYLPTPVLYRNALYVLYDKGIFSRYKVETGERVLRSRVAPEASAFTASPWAYDGKIFLLSEEGDTFIVEAGEEYRLLGVNSLDEFALATPAIVGDRLLIRTQSHLYSIRNRH